MPKKETIRQNHYVPIWYQKRFMPPGSNRLHVVDVTAAAHINSNTPRRPSKPRAPKSLFWTEDLYTTRIGNRPSDDVEKFLFGAIDNSGAIATRAFSEGNPSAMHSYFQTFFDFMGAQKLRTPRGLDWIRAQYTDLSQSALMLELQFLRQMFGTMWFESVAEVVSATDSEIKFIVSDHPIAAYNAACPPTSAAAQYPSEPSISLVGTQTIFPLDIDHCLILTNLEYAKNAASAELLRPRTNARFLGKTIARTDAVIRARNLKASEVARINFVLKKCSRQFIAAGDARWLFPENSFAANWDELAQTLLPPTVELSRFGGEIIVGFKDGSSHYQDQFGRTARSTEHLDKRIAGEPAADEACGCGSGQRYSRCCQSRPLLERPPWNVKSIRERNLMFLHALERVLEFDKGKTWEDVRAELKDDQVKLIHELYDLLWPEDTSVAELLPHPDQRVFRAVYMGPVDPRTIASNVTCWLNHFDEIVILNPFVQSKGIRPEYSPTQNPKGFRQQTLKNVLFMLTVEPFIASGRLHVVPDPLDNNPVFRDIVLGMAKDRTKGMVLDESQPSQFRRLAEDDFRRAVLGMPDDYLRQQIKSSSPKLSEGQVESTLKYMRKQRQSDPLALLQDRSEDHKWSEMWVTKGISLELAMFFAQVSGSILFTSELETWKQIRKQVSGQSSARSKTDWDSLTQLFRRTDILVEIDPMRVLAMLSVGRHEPSRSALRRMQAEAILPWQQSGSPFDAMAHARAFADSVDEANRYVSELLNESPISTVRKFRFDPLIPRRGFRMNSVQRLTLVFGRQYAHKGVPMAIFVRDASS